MLERFDLIISADTEYTKSEYLDGVLPEHNAVVSVQGVCFNPTTAARCVVTYAPRGPHHRHRPTFEGFLIRAIEAARRAGVIPWEMPTGRNYKIGLVFHFSRADLSSFKNYHNIKKRFDNVRGTWVSVDRPAIFTASLTNGQRINISVDLIDTKLMAPDKYKSLRELGELVGLSKLSVPDVRDESGAVVEGISRMDLVLRDHPAAFWAYAVRDCEVALEFLILYTRHFIGLGLANGGRARLPKTIGSMGVAVFKNMEPPPDLPNLLGREVDERGRLAGLMPEHANILGTLADSFAGGRNECFIVGEYLSAPGAVFRDDDLKGAYVTAMAFIKAMDWRNVEHTTDLERLAQLDEPAVARISFKFPEHVKFPCIAIDAGDHGLLYAREGTATVTSFELFQAVAAGLNIEDGSLIIHAGVRLPWLEGAGDLPFVNYAVGVNDGRARFPKGSLFEQLEKTRGNVLFGKSGQNIAAHKTENPRVKRVFNPRTGTNEALPESSISCGIVAAIASGLPRAALSEILHNIPRHVKIFSATTDGFLTDGTEEEIKAATTGPICQLYSRLRTLVDAKQSGDVLELKHLATHIVSIKTRGTLSGDAVPVDPKKPGEFILARCGHRLTKEPTDPADESAKFIEIYRTRTYDTALYRHEFISPAAQWGGATDLLSTYRRVRVAMCYDLKRRPVNVRNGESGLIEFETVAWRDIAEFEEWRESFDRWRASTASVLRTAEDWQRFLAWRLDRRRQSLGRMTPLQRAIILAYAHNVPGFETRATTGRRRAGDDTPTRGEVAARMAEAMGVEVTLTTFKNYREREPDPRDYPVATVLPEDIETLERLGWRGAPERLKPLLTEAAFEGLKPVYRQRIVNLRSLICQHIQSHDIERKRGLFGNGLISGMGEKEMSLLISGLIKALEPTRAARLKMAFESPMMMHYRPPGGNGDIARRRAEIIAATLAAARAGRGMTYA